jgi:hypothetical protein
MTSKVAIVNRALTKLGATRIVALTDNTKEAREMAATFDIVRDSELRANRWSFSIARAELAADITAPLFEYSHRFPLPSDYLRGLMIGTLWPGVDISDYRTGPSGQDWAIEGGYILFNSAGPLRLRYISRVTDTTLWDASFVEAFACKLAVETCEAITQSSEKRQLAQSEYATALQVARRAGAIELPPQQIADDTWVVGRLRA